MTRRTLTVSLSLVGVAASALWLAYAWVRFLGAAFPERGVVITLPINGSVQFENGVLHSVSGPVRLLDYGGWWAGAFGGPFLLIVVMAVYGCLAAGRGGSQRGG
jgi:hypothetical protein